VVYNGFAFDTKGALSDEQCSMKYDACVQGSGPVTLLMAGSLHPGKGQEDAVRALSDLVSRGYDAELTLAGSGEDRYIAFLHSLSKELDVEERVRWPGFTDPVSPLYAEAAAVLICSRAEAFGRVAVEALASGTPVIGARGGGLPEIIEDRVSGLLYEPGDHQGLADQIEALLSNRDRYCEILRNGHQSVINRFSEEQYITGIESIIRELTAQRRDNKSKLNARRQ
jgi:glycosyltransferase involved in cell wall biosynthesis